MALFLNVICNLASMVIGWFLKMSWNSLVARRPYVKVLGIPSDEKVYIVLPHRPLPANTSPNTMRTHVTFEDMLAANYAERTLSLAGFDDKMISIRSVDQYKRDRTFLEQQHLILICSTKANDITKDALSILNSKVTGFKFDFTKINSNPDEWGMIYGGATIKSDSYRQNEEYIAQGKDPEQNKQDDSGVLIRVNSPWNKDKKIFIIAGIRGIGTWGAARCLRDNADKILNNTKGQDFVHIVQVTYDNYKMVDTRPDIFFFKLKS